jgi:hypothetical protein
VARSKDVGVLHSRYFVDAHGPTTRRALVRNEKWQGYFLLIEGKILAGNYYSSSFSQSSYRPTVRGKSQETLISSELALVSPLTKFPGRRATIL